MAMFFEAVQTKPKLGTGFAFFIGKEEKLSMKIATGAGRRKTFTGEDIR